MSDDETIGVVSLVRERYLACQSSRVNNNPMSYLLETHLQERIQCLCDMTCRDDMILRYRYSAREEDDDVL